MRLFRKRKAAPVGSAPPKSLTGPLEVDPGFLKLFDPNWYLEVNRDVAAAGMDALTHFILHGEAEGRDPNPAFSTCLYRETFMQGEPVDASPVLHYLRRGRDLGYDPDPASLINYRRLVAAQEQSYGLELPELRRHIALMIAKPLFIVYLDSNQRNSLGAHSEHASGSDL